ncbi:Spx/MgsR family RNA polymerase-binding regulatory protein [Polycladidibacter stylochi]|uniref:Spx/MgsR family RNA polymerase-binding regulatory protein n=1 Tax=Polycladidibacter stylochi TaxID=1807766 RepID=UPI000829A6F0|nr:Spx/MgsR family RNA polymerase-binding regulatory protein [Pseudovibrio stylochi]
MIKVFGISNCDSVRKTRKFLEAAGADFEFHDYKKEGVPVEMLTAAIDTLGLDIVLNKRGTTYRKLSDEEKQQAATVEGALALMVGSASLIKRPLVVTDTRMIAGHDTDALAQLVKA